MVSWYCLHLRFSNSEGFENFFICFKSHGSSSADNFLFKSFVATSSFFFNHVVTLTYIFWLWEMNPLSVIWAINIFLILLCIFWFFSDVFWPWTSIVFPMCLRLSILCVCLACRVTGRRKILQTPRF